MVTAIVGANWGDEGKGKITDLLASESDIVIRFQGGANAGHTIINDHGRFALHLMPSGVCHENIVNIIGNGVALDIRKFINEYNSIKEQGLNPQLLVSDRVQVVMPYHVDFDKFEEERLGGKAFGSTKSGIAPFFSDKYAKIGFQVSELFDEATLKEKIERVLEIKNALLVNLYHKDPINADELLAEMLEQGRLIKPFVTNTQAYLYDAIKDLRYESAAAYSGRISLCNNNDLLDLIRRDACADAAVACQCGRRCNHRVDAHVGILHGSELTFEKDVLACLYRVEKESVSINNERLDELALLEHLLSKLVRIDRILMVEVNKKRILDLEDSADLLAQCLFVEQLAYLETDLRILIGEERSDTGLGGTECLAAQSLLFILIKIYMVRHDYLYSVGNHELGVKTLGADVVVLVDELSDVECHTVADDVNDILVADTGRHQVQCESSVLVNDRMSCIRASLEADYNIRFAREKVRDLAFTLVTPVSAYDRLYHNKYSLLKTLS